jgi:hypothetical protein
LRALPDEPAPDDNAPEDLASQLQGLARQLLDLARAVHEEAKDSSENQPDEAPSPGERVIYALGQLHRLHLAGRLPGHPSTVLIEDLVCVLGIGDALEFMTEDAFGQHYHFGSEVIYVDPGQPFPRLMSVEQWASQQEFNSLWAEGEED